jgi:hypothetical protein
LNHYPSNCLEKVRKTTKISVRTVGVSANIRTRYLPNTNSEALYHFGRFSFLQTFFPPTFARKVGQHNFVYVSLLSYTPYRKTLQTNVLQLIDYRFIFCAMCQLFVRRKFFNSTNKGRL